MKKALVTGATGFIGSRLVRGLLRDGWQVDALVRPTSTLVRLSGVDKEIGLLLFDGKTTTMLELVVNSSPDVVFHAASLFVSEHQPEQIESLIRSNVLLGTQLLEAMAKAGCKYLVNTSTSWEHYENKDYSPVNLYAATKRAFQDILQFYVEANGIRAITLKLFDTYGPDDPRPKLINLLLQAAATGEPLSLSPGEQKLNLVHVDDVVAAYSIAAQRLLEGRVHGHEVYGVGGGRPISLRQLVTLVEQVSGKKLNIKWGGRPYRKREVMEPASTYPLLPGWVPRWSLEAGLKSCIMRNVS